jgi:hypothetical protein
VAVCESGGPEVDSLYRKQVELLTTIAEALMELHKFHPREIPFIDDSTITVYGVGHVSWYGFGWTFVPDKDVP